MSQGRSDAWQNRAACGAYASARVSGARSNFSQTHNLHIAHSLADFVVSLGPNGTIAHTGPFSEVLLTDQELSREFEHDTAEDTVEAVLDPNEPLNSGGLQTDKQHAAGKLVMLEEVANGHVSWQACQAFCRSHDVDHTNNTSVYLYISGAGGRLPFVFWSLFFCGVILTSAAETLQVWFLGYWTRAYDSDEPSEVDVW